jgi:alpha-L-fucosidase 2
MRQLPLLCIVMVSSWGAMAQDYKLWYKQPANKWTDALPLGNGRIGMMVYGGIEKDRIQFNEETLWTGAPRAYNRPDAAQYLPDIRRLLAEGKQKEAEALAETHFMGLKSNEGDKQKWLDEVLSAPTLADTDFDDSHWKTLPVPAYDGWESVGLEGIDGVVWFRTTVEIPESWQGKEIVLDLNRIRDHDLTYINGVLIGTTNGTDPRRYEIPYGTWKVGENTIAVEVINYTDKGGLMGYKEPDRAISVRCQDLKIPINGLWKYYVQNDSPPAVAKYQADYQPFGDLFLNFKSQSPSDYRRELRLNTATAHTFYREGGIDYTRTYFVSQPHQVAVVHLTATRTKSISFEALLSSPHKKYTLRKVNKNTIAVALKVRGGALFGESYLQIKHKGGSLVVSDSSITVREADEATLYLSAATNYVNFNDVSGNPTAKCMATMAALTQKTYPQILKEHMAEYQQYYNKFLIELGQKSTTNLSTTQRLENFGVANDPSFSALYVQYGRYLLISCSRPNTNPANLQGIWNDQLIPPWGGKYTTNINAEMNYWPAEPLNLSALHGPLFGMIKDLAQTGRAAARSHYGARGWVLHHNTDLWRGAAPINAANHGIWLGGAGWLCQHLWQHYSFTQDEGFLRTEAYPVMKEAARFYVDFLIKDPKSGWLISSPSNSPENGGLVAGPTMDHQIIRDLLKNCIEASKILKVDAPLRDTLQNTYHQIAPNQIGKHGQLQEWLEDKDQPNNNHRHVSHLWGVHPGHEINWDQTPALMKAARQSLIYRGDEGTGWSLAWKINFWARFKEADHALKMVKMLLRPVTVAGGSYPNLFDAHPPFQIDGNFGGAAGIVEMLVQSHTQYIDILPALPSDWSSGKLSNVCVNGGFELSFSWNNGTLSNLKVYSKAGRPCTLRYNNKILRLETIKNKTTDIVLSRFR